MKVTGVPYEEIARAGGGIRVLGAGARPRRATTRCSTRPRRSPREMLAHGTTTFECKSGYGLSRSGRARARSASPRELGARGHADDDVDRAARPRRPRRLRRRRLDGRGRQARPRGRARRRRASALDIYVESIAFDNDHLPAHGRAGRAPHGLDLRAHVEQFNTNRSVPVALEAGRALGRPPVAHRIPTTSRRSARAECAAVLLPGAEFLGDEHVAAGPRPRRRRRDLRPGHRRQSGDVADRLDAAGDRPRRPALRLERARGARRGDAQRGVGPAPVGGARVAGSRQARGRARPRRLRSSMCPTGSGTTRSRWRSSPASRCGCVPTPRGGCAAGDRRGRPRGAVGRARGHRRARATASHGWRGRRRMRRAERGSLSRRRRRACASRPIRRGTSGRCPAGDGPWWGVGSHLDSVRSGGRFDGPLGVAAAFEVAARVPGARRRRGPRRRGGRPLQHADVRQPGARRAPRRRRGPGAPRRRRHHAARRHGRGRCRPGRSGRSSAVARPAARVPRAAHRPDPRPGGRRPRRRGRRGARVAAARPGRPRTVAPTTRARRAATSGATRCRPPPG